MIGIVTISKNAPPYSAGNHEKKKKQNILYISNLQGTADPQHRAKNTFPNIIE
jgi:hypothetical protein